IVSFDLAVLDTLAAFDVPVAGVPKSTYEKSLARYKNTTVNGTLYEPDYTLLNRIQPDHIISGSRSAKAVPGLSKVAPTVSFNSDTNAFMKTFRDNNLALGRAFGKEEQASAALAAIDRNVEELQRINKGKKGVMLFAIRG